MVAAEAPTEQKQLEQLKFLTPEVWPPVTDRFLTGRQLLFLLLLSCVWCRVACR